MYSYVIGNKEKTKFLRYDRVQRMRVAVEDVAYADTFDDAEAYNIITTNMYTEFFMENNLTEVYKVSHAIVL